MIIIAKEAKVADVFANYKNAVAFSTTPAKKGCQIADKTIGYEQLNFLPSNDDINAIKNGEKKLKKIIKDAVKALKDPKAEGAATIGLNMGMLITAATSDRRNKNGPPVLVFILDDEDDIRNKVIKKFLKALFAEFGIKPVKTEKVKKLFKVSKKKLKKANKGRKKKDRQKPKGLVKGRIIEFESEKKNKCGLSNKGLELKKNLLRYYDIELRQLAATKLGATDLNGATAQSWAKSLVRTYSAENIKELSSKKYAKLLAKKDKKAAKYYNELRDILRSMDGDMKLPKVEFGQKKKKGKAKGAKFDTKKFVKFYTRYRNRGYLLLVFGHTMLRLLGAEIGSKEYNQQMTIVCNNIGVDGFTKLYKTAAAAYVNQGTESK
ncbi:MAG: hypothetical protein NC489_09065 [Ruminococcus flavefaciens]|nr:hypothetical protein [Ruminococcus flavefaciens]